MEDEKVLRLCQRGVGNYSGALDDANNLFSECYGTIGRLMNRREILRNELAYLYGQEKIPAIYKDAIKKALDSA